MRPDGLSTFSTQHVEANATAVTNAMACVLKQICDIGDSKLKSAGKQEVGANPAGSKNPFEGGRGHLSIGILDFCQRVRKYSNCSASCFVLAVMYIDRLIHKKRTNIVINSLTIHRLIIVSVVCSIKMWDDKFYPNSFYAKVGGLAISELNRLEAFFLFALNFDMHVLPADFDQYLITLTDHATNGRCKQGCKPLLEKTAIIPLAFTPRPCVAAECVTPKSHCDARKRKPVRQPDLHKNTRPRISQISQTPPAPAPALAAQLPPLHPPAQ